MSHWASAERAQALRNDEALWLQKANQISMQMWNDRFAAAAQCNSAQFLAHFDALNSELRAVMERLRGVRGELKGIDIYRRAQELIASCDDAPPKPPRPRKPPESERISYFPPGERHAGEIPHVPWREWREYPLEFTLAAPIVDAPLEEPRSHVLADDIERLSHRLIMRPSQWKRSRRYEGFMKGPNPWAIHA